MPNRRFPQPTVVHGVVCRLLVFELPDQLTLRVRKCAIDIGVLGDRYQRRTTGQNGTQRDALLLAAAILQRDIYFDISLVPLSQVRSQRRQHLHDVVVFLGHEAGTYLN